MDSDYLASPLRYPGGKSKVARRLLPFLPPHTEYREPFVGGGGIFFAKPKARVNWINDSHPGLYAFYKVLRDRGEELCLFIRDETKTTPRASFNYWVDDGRRFLMERHGDEGDMMMRAVQYYVINRLVWSGRVCYDPKLKSRLFFSNPSGLSNIDKRIEHLRLCSEKLQGVEITNQDINDPILCGPTPPLGDRETFVYADPPYLRDCDASPTSRLYEKVLSREGHYRGINEASESKCKIMFSYEDTPEVRELFAGHPWHIIPLTWTYCGRHAVTKEATANGTKEVKPIGKELLICNYDIPEAARSFVQ